MARSQFVETITVPLGPGGSLIPVSGIGSQPIAVDSTGQELPDQPVGIFADRISSTQVPPSALVTDQNGTVSYWLNTGDYNIHFTDSQSPPRVEPYVRGYSAFDVNIEDLVNGIISYIAAPGDLKFSFAIADHGAKPDGSYEWLLMTPDTSGNGRLVSSTTYPVLYGIIGGALDASNNFRLPNIAGRVLMATGQGTNDGNGATLPVRNLNDIFGVVQHAHLAGIPVSIPALDVPPLSIPDLILNGLVPHSHPLSPNGGVAFNISIMGGGSAGQTAGAQFFAGGATTAGLFYQYSSLSALSIGETNYTHGESAYPGMGLYGATDGVDAPIEGIAQGTSQGVMTGGGTIPPSQGSADGATAVSPGSSGATSSAVPAAALNLFIKT
jgi:hypothetical protein